MKNNKYFKKIDKNGYVIIRKVFKRSEINDLKNLCISLNKKNYKKKVKKPNKSKTLF